MFCYCNDYIDIRARCLPERNRKMWHKCSSKIDTTYWLIMNDYNIYKLIDEYCIEDDRVIDAIKANILLLIKIGKES
jgi:hypothetical protein